MEISHIVLQVLVLILALSFLAETESKADKKTDKRGVLNVGNDGKIGSGSIGDSSSYKNNAERGGDISGSTADHLGQG